MREQTSFLLVSAESSFVTIVVSLMLLGGMCCLVKFGRRFSSHPERSLGEEKAEPPSSLSLSLSNAAPSSPCPGLPLNHPKM